MKLKNIIFAVNNFTNNNIALVKIITEKKKQDKTINIYVLSYDNLIII